MSDVFGYGVKYRDEDYAGFFRRVMVMAIDVVVVFVIVVLGCASDIMACDNFEYYDGNYGLYVSLALAYLYLTSLKVSKIGSIGQRLTRTRVETIFGKCPGQIRMTLRLFFWVFGPINFLTDLFFITIIKERRSIRDCFCNTIVVKRASEPVESQVPIHIARIHAFGLNLMYESCNSEYS